MDEIRAVESSQSTIGGRKPDRPVSFRQADTGMLIQNLRRRKVANALSVVPEDPRIHAASPERSARVVSNFFEVAAFRLQRRCNFRKPTAVKFPESLSPRGNAHLSVGCLGQGGYVH